VATGTAPSYSNSFLAFWIARHHWHLVIRVPFTECGCIMGCHAVSKAIGIWSFELRSYCRKDVVCYPKKIHDVAITCKSLINRPVKRVVSLLTLSESAFFSFLSYIEFSFAFWYYEETLFNAMDGSCSLCSLLNSSCKRSSIFLKTNYDFWSSLTLFPQSGVT